MRRSLLLLLVLVSACSSSSVAAPKTTVAPTSARPVATRPPFAVTNVTGAVKFVSADGNLGCDIEPAYARCDPRNRDWPVPPQPADCASGWGHGIEMQAQTKASFFCGSDSVLGGTRVLAPGKAFKNGFVQCDAISATTIHCHDVDNAHGFTISKARYVLA